MPGKGPPAPAALVHAAVHPAITGCVGAFFFGGTMAVGSAGSYRQVVIQGLAMGILSYFTAIIERTSMEHYRFQPRATLRPTPTREYREDVPGLLRRTVRSLGQQTAEKHRNRSDYRQTSSHGYSPEGVRERLRGTPWRTP
ncbi:hypothetical protein ACWC9U_33805 [Streptomyces sp. 900116325]